jgi:hypothetical protein
MPNVASYLRVDADLSGDPLGTPSWTDYTQHFQSCRISRGRAGVFDLYKVGTLQLTARNGRTGVDTPWLDPDVWYRWRQIRVVWTGGVTDIPLFTGYITKTEHSLNQPRNVNLVTISAVDKLGIIQQEALDFSGTAAADPDGVWANNGLAVGTVDTFLDGFSENFAGDTVDVYGGSTCPIFFQAVEDDVPGQAANTRKKVRRRTVAGNFWQLLQDALEAEYGTMQVDADGGFAFNGRYASLVTFGSTGAQRLTINDNPDETPDYRFLEGSLEVAAPGTDYFDAAVATGTTKNQQKTSVTPSGYPETVYARTALPCPNDNWTHANTVMWASLFSQTSAWPRKAAIALERYDPELLLTSTVTLGRVLAEIDHTSAGDGTVLSWYGLIEGIDHDIQVDGPWKATLSMSNAFRWISPYGTFDDYGYIGSTWTLGTSRVAP